MEENVALDSTKQKQFVKNIKGIKKMLQNKKEKNKSDDLKKADRNIVNIGKIVKRKRKIRGLVYLSHIPHGFYEHQMTEYFKQFGVVTNARVIRSKRTGASKGHAFVEFSDPNVAQIVADTMNNYLMGKRLIKAQLIPPEKQRRFAMRKNWNAQNNPGNDFRQKMKKAHNSIKDEKEELKNAKRLMSNLCKTRKKLRELDIDYDFFAPVDIPEPLLNPVEVKNEEDDGTIEVKKEKQSKKVKEEISTLNGNTKEKAKQPGEIEITHKVMKQTKQVEIPAKKKSKKSKEAQKSVPSSKTVTVDTNDNMGATPKVVKNPAKDGTKGQDQKTDIIVLKHKTQTKTKESKSQNKKENVLKHKEVKAPKNFVKVPIESGDGSDSSVEFDSDEYEKMIEEGDSEVQSDSESDVTGDLDEVIPSEGESVEDITPTPPKKSKSVSLQKTQPMQSKKQDKKPIVNKPAPQPKKRMPQKELKASKMNKFEKKGKKTLNKVIKKKK